MMELNEQQQKAVNHVNGPALVLAGPGSGKTTVIISRLKRLVSKVGINSRHILSMTFNKAAQIEMQQRCDKLLGTGHGIRFSTLHSFCNSVVCYYERRQNKRLKRIEGNYPGKVSKQMILKQIYLAVNQSPIQDDALEELVNEIGFVKNKMLKDFDGYEYNTKNLPLIYEAYDQYKKKNLFMDFDDMLSYAYAILQKCPDILAYYRSKYRYIQIDEGQDLSKIQFAIVKLLAMPSNNVFIVADDDQSIYGFRGAEPQHILNIEKEFPNCRIYYLEHNYRSSKNIVEMSSRLIKRNIKRFDKNHKTHNEYKYDPVIKQTADEHGQLKYILKVIKRMTKKGITDIAVLYRNNLSSIGVADMLDRNHIPFTIRQNKLAFFNHWVILDILAFFKFALDQSDTESFMRICYKMNRYLSKSMVEHALTSQYDDSIIDGILTYPGLQPFQLKKIREIKKEFIRLAKMSPLHALRYIENDFCYFDAVREFGEYRGVSGECLCKLAGILNTIAAGCSSVPMFLQRLSDLNEMFENPPAGEFGKTVTLSTLHSSKGLEYDCVLMIDLIDEDFPGMHSIELMQKGYSDMLEEERRLFYVGMTRAREHLYLISPMTRNNQRISESMFIDELMDGIHEKALGALEKGMLVTHKQYGEGIIVEIIQYNYNSVTLIIDFDGVKRSFDFATCIQKGILIY